MITQSRRTAGIRLVHGESHIHIDPGPGALIFSNWAKLSHRMLDALIVTHCHPDHYCDAEVLTEAMSHGAAKKRGILAAPKSVLYGDDGLGPGISAYHKGLVNDVVVLSPSSRFEVKGLKIEAVEARHGDPHTVGLRIDAPGDGVIGYTSDTAYYEGLSNLYKGVRLLILCTMRPRRKPLPLHLSIDDAVGIVEGARPGCVVLTHFGMMMLKAGPEAEGMFLEEETGVPTVAAKDGMTITLADEIEVKGPTKKDEARIIRA